MSASTDLVPTTDAGALERDPAGYMQVVLNRAKGWLAEAQSIESVRETKAVAVGYESVIREKELAFDAQLSATEIVRRCERRIGELVREGQQDGTIAKRGDIGGTPQLGTRGSRRGHPRGEHLDSPAQIVPHAQERSDHYTMADVPVADFEQAIDEAREEGNLSRANVVRKVKGDAETKRPTATAGENGRLASGRSVQRIAAQAASLEMAIGAIPLNKSCSRLSADERAEALEKCKKGRKAINALVNALLAASERQ